MTGGTSSDHRWRERTHEELLALATENRRRTLERLREIEAEGRRGRGPSKTSPAEKAGVIGRPLLITDRSRGGEGR